MVCHSKISTGSRSISTRRWIVVGEYSIPFYSTSESEAEKHAKQGPEDAAEVAYRVVGTATGRIQRFPMRRKSKKAVGRGKARAARLTAARRSEIARNAANVRWGKA